MAWTIPVPKFAQVTRYEQSARLFLELSSGNATLRSTRNVIEKGSPAVGSPIPHDPMPGVVRS